MVAVGSSKSLAHRYQNKSRHIPTRSNTHSVFQSSLGSVNKSQICDKISMSGRASCVLRDIHNWCCRETDAEDELAAMGTSQEVRRKPRGQVLMNPGLPHRRYSVPETVMRKYALTKQLSVSSDSGVATVPVATPDTIQPGSSSDEPTAGTSSPDSSDHSKMGNRAAKGTCCTGHTEGTTSEGLTRSTLHTVSEETSDTVSQNCTESNSEPMSSSQMLLEESSFGTQKFVRPQNTADCQSQISKQNYLSATPTVMGDGRPPSKPHKGAEEKPSNVAAPTESLSSVKGDMPHSQARGPKSADSKPPSPNNKEYQNRRQDTESPEPQSSLKDDSSSSHTTGLESTDSRSSGHNTGSHQSPQNISETGEPRSSANNDLSTHKLDVKSTDNTPKTSKKELRKGPKTGKNVEIEQSISSVSRHVGCSSSSTLGTTGPHTSSRNDTSSSQTMGPTSTESRLSTTPDRALVISGRSSTPKTGAQASPETPGSGMTHCSQPGINASGTPTEYCVTTSDPDHSHSLSSASDRASQSCSITPVDSTVSTSSPERPSGPVQSVLSSVSPPSSDHTVSTQDTTLSVKSDTAVPDRPASVTVPVMHDEETRGSDSEQSMGHIEFMNDSRDNDSTPTVNTLHKITSRSAEPNPRQMEDSGHVSEPNCEVSEVGLNTNDSIAETSANTEKSTLNTQVSSKQVSTNTKFADSSYQSRSWEIIIHPTTVQHNLSKCPDDGVCGTGSKQETGNKKSVLPPKEQDLKFCGSKTCLVIRPSVSTTVPAGVRLSGTSTYPPTKCRSSPGNQPLTTSHEVLVFAPTGSPSRTEELDPYSWSRLTEEEHEVQLQLQRHRLWMNRRISTANALPISPMQGPISSCVATGSTYRKSQDSQLVVPRYSALPRSMSMLVNTSSGECSSNSNSDSECLSLADSLEERPSSRTGRHKPTKHDSKPVRGDVVQLLPDDRNHKHNLHRRINAATPRGKGKAFFVSMENGLEEAGTVKIDKNFERQVISESMPVRLKQKLSQRHQQMDLKKKKKKPENQHGKKETNTEQENIGTEVQSDGVVSLQQTAGTDSKQDLPQTETESREEVKVRETSVPTQGISQSSTELAPHVRSQSTAIRYTVAQSSTGEGTFIVSRNEDQGQTEQQSPQQCTAEGVTKFSNTGKTFKKEPVSKEHNEPVKRLKVSKHKTPLQNNQDTLRQDDNTSRSRAIMLKENKHEEKSPPLKVSNSVNDHTTVRDERRLSEEETGVKTGNSAGNGNKEHDTPKNEVVCAVQGSEEVAKDVKPVEEVTSPERSNGEVEENVITQAQKTEEEKEPSVKTANGSRLKTQKGHTSPKESDVSNKSSTTTTNEPKNGGQNCPLKTSLNDMITETRDTTRKAQRLRENGEKPSEEIQSHEVGDSVLKLPEKLGSKEPKVPQKQPEKFENALKHTTKTQKIDNGVAMKNRFQTRELQQAKAVQTAENNPTARDAGCQKTEHEHVRKPDTAEDNEPEAAETSPEKKTLSTVSSQTSPEHKCEETRNSAPNTDPNSNKPELPQDQIRNSIRPLQLPLKSSIPIMKSPIAARKLSTDPVITSEQPLQNSQLPARTPRLQAQMRRSAHLLGGKFHQRFEVIPEERSVSLDSSTEDQSWLTTDRCLRASLPAGQAGTKTSTGTTLGSRCNIVSHSCLGLNQTGIRHKQNRHSAPNSETSSSTHEVGGNGNMRATRSDTTRKVIRRPTCQSRIPRVEKVIRQTRIPEDMICDGQEKRMDYQGKAALAPHTEDKDLVTLSKGWLNFYLLKDGCTTPDSSCEEGNVGCHIQERVTITFLHNILHH